MSKPIYIGGEASIENLSYMARLAYHLGRHIDPKTHAALLQMLQPLTQLNRVKEMAHLRLPLTWALLRNRQRSE